MLHTPDTDYLTTCATLVACLTEIRDWSRQNPRHVPIQIQIEAKDGARKDARFVVPIPIGAAEFRALDQEIRSVFDEKSLDHARSSPWTPRHAGRSGQGRRLAPAA